MRLFRQKAGVISKQLVWCFYDRGYLYIEDTLPQLVWTLLTQWRHDRHLVG